MELSLFTIKKWGMWKTVTSPERYVDSEYSTSRFTVQMMDHLVPYTGSNQTVGCQPDIEWINDASDDEDAERSVPVDLSQLVDNLVL